MFVFCWTDLILFDGGGEDDDFAYRSPIGVYYQPDNRRKASHEVLLVCANANSSFFLVLSLSSVPLFR